MDVTGQMSMLDSSNVTDTADAITVLATRYCIVKYCVTFAESEPYCHSILFVCLSVIPRPTAYHD